MVEAWPPRECLREDLLHLVVAKIGEVSAIPHRGVMVASCDPKPAWAHPLAQGRAVMPTADGIKAAARLPGEMFCIGGSCFSVPTVGGRAGRADGRAGDLMLSAAPAILNTARVEKTA